MPPHTGLKAFDWFYYKYIAPTALEPGPDSYQLKAKILFLKSLDCYEFPAPDNRF